MLDRSKREKKSYVFGVDRKSVSKSLWVRIQVSHSNWAMTGEHPQDRSYWNDLNILNAV